MDSSSTQIFQIKDTKRDEETLNFLMKIFLCFLYMYDLQNRLQVVNKDKYIQVNWSCLWDKPILWPQCKEQEVPSLTTDHCSSVFIQCSRFQFKWVIMAAKIGKKSNFMTKMVNTKCSEVKTFLASRRVKAILWRSVLDKGSSSVVGRGPVFKFSSAGVGAGVFPNKPGRRVHDFFRPLRF